MNIKPLVAEFIGTFALIFLGVGSIAMDHMTGGKVGLVGIALAHGLAIGVMASATMAVSGGQFNPAVSIGLWAIKKMTAIQTVSYIVAQCLGAAAAAFTIKMALPAEVLSAVNLGTPGLGAGISVSMALVTETILTFFLVFVICGTAVDSRAPKCGGLFIGLAVAMDVLMGGPVSGAAMNPARHFGPALLGGGFQNVWIYWAGPILGAVMATQVYNRVMKSA